jgi:hypothetical protein
MNETVRAALLDDVSIFIPSPHTCSIGTNGRPRSCGRQALKSCIYKSIVCDVLIQFCLATV